MWVGIPLSVPGKDWLNNEVKIRIRVAKPYEKYFSSPMDSASVANSQNKQLPMYRFETESVATENNNADKAKSDLDLIQAVPNPYYEENALTNKIKITNLPVQCIISIYNVNGTLIRQITKDEQKTSVDWDLTNFAGVPIAGGVYIIHVHSSSGDKIIKWFGGLRTPDLNVF
jgi:flagellar hook assembly protein FlgD